MEYYEDIIVQENGNVKCILCSSVFQDENSVIESHVNDMEHKKLYLLRLMARNNIVSNGNAYSCNICPCEIVDKASLICHVKSFSHGKLIEDIEEVIENDGAYMELPQTKNSLGIYCYICDRYINFTLQDTKNHISSMVHIRARVMAVQPPNAIFSVDDDDNKDEYLYCKLCTIYFENYIELIFEHINCTNHLKNRSKILDIVKGQNIDVEDYFTDPKNDCAFCYLCSKQVPCNVINLMSHITGKAHKDLVERCLP